MSGNLESSISSMPKYAQLAVCFFGNFNVDVVFPHSVFYNTLHIISIMYDVNLHVCLARIMWKSGGFCDSM